MKVKPGALSPVPGGREDELVGIGLRHLADERRPVGMEQGERTVLEFRVALE